MNKIFKVVWSKVKHCYVVVSEIAKNTTSGGARRCRMGKVSLAAAMAAAVLTGSFAMPNSAWAAWDSEWNKWRPNDYNDENKSYDDASHGNSYEAMVVLSATTQDNGTGLGIVLYRGDRISDSGSHLSANAEYLHPSDAHAALGELWNKDYAYTKIENSATAEFDQILNQTINQTVVNDIVTMINSGQNAVAIPTYSQTQKTDSNGNPLYYDDNGNETTVNTNNPVYTIEGYTVHSADSKVISLANSVSGINNNGTLATAITQKEAVLDNQGRPVYENGKIKYEEKVYTDNINYVSGGGKQENGVYKDTYITISDGTNSFNLETGSKVVGITADGSNALTGLEINGEPFTISTTDTKLVVPTNGEYDGTPVLDVGNDGTLTLTVKDTAGNVVSGSAEIGEYVSEKITNEAKNATYITNTDGTKVITIGDQITDLTNTVNAGWVAKIGDTIVKEVKPGSNELSFVAGENVTLENENGAIKINANLNSGGSPEIDLNAGENIKLETDNNQDGSITIIADIEGKGYIPDWQQQRLMASAQEDSGQEVTGKPTYEGQLKELRIGNKLYSVPVISAIENAGNEDPLLRALELDGQAYRVVSTDYRLVGSEVTGENDNTSYTGAYQVTRGEDGKNKVELNVYDNYSGVLANDKIVITGMATQEEFNALKFGVIKTTTGTGEETVTTNKLGLVGLNGANFGSVEVTTAVGSGGNDATITFGGIDSFTLPVGSTVRANVDDIVVSDDTAYLKKISVNGTPYKVLTIEEIENNIENNMGAINNLSVSGGEVSSVDNSSKHGWQITDSAQQGVVYKDTTLIPGNAKTTSSDPSTNTYEVKDTAGNVVTIDDVASAKYVNEKFEDISEDITNLNTRVGTVENKITQINQNIANAKVEVEAGSNITVAEDEIDGGGKKYTISAKDTVTTVNAGNNVTVEGGLDEESGNYAYTISATDTNTVNQHMKGTGWIAGDDGNPTDNLLIKVNDSDGKFVEATIEDVAKASNLRKESDERKEADATLAQAIINNQQDVQNLNAGLNKLGNRMNKVGAGSAALAALHPMDFDPDDKLQFSAGVGHYGGENAAALGAFYRPTEKVMFSVAGTMGNGEDMVNAGVTFALDKPNNVSNSRVAMAREIQDLRQQVAALTMLVMQMASRDNAALAGVAMFPDVPENHWAYDYIEGLQKQGIIDGYPDGNFGGDRTMTRYEFAAMLYRALEKGFPVDSRLLNEFNAELGRIRVDRIKGADNDANKVERVRVNNYEDRDDYGSKIVQVKAGA